MGRSTHVAAGESIILLATEPMLRHRPAGAEPNEILTMTDTYDRRHTDRGYVAQFPTPVNAIRSVLGLVPVTEKLSSLSHWRRRRPAAQESAGS